MILTASEPLVVLRGGLAVPVDALRLLWALEDRGAVIRIDGETLIVGPRRLLTDDDREQIRRHKDELLRLVSYIEETAQ